jgi:hypothetical protein
VSPVVPAFGLHQLDLIAAALDAAIDARAAASGR